MKILVLSSRFPLPLEKGDKLRIFHQIKYLAQHHEVILISLTEPHFDLQWVHEMEQICSKVYHFPLNRIRSVWQVFRGLFTGTPANVSYFYHPNIRSKIVKIFEEERPDFTYVQLIRMATYARGLPGPKALDYMDAFSLRVARRLKISKSNNWFWKLEQRRLAVYEGRVSRWFDHHFVIAERDRAELMQNGVLRPILLRNGVDTDFFAPTNHHEKPYDIAFVGNMSYHPNIVAAHYLVQELLPLLKQEDPSIRILIAGARPSASVKKLAGPGVAVSGYLPDIRSAYQSARIFVAPIFVGSGLQNKILEALAMGIPCVTTSIVAQPIGAPGRIVRQADNAIEMKKHIIQLLSVDQPMAAIREEARFFVQTHFSWPGSCAPLGKLLGEEIVVEK